MARVPGNELVASGYDDGLETRTGPPGFELIRMLLAGGNSNVPAKALLLFKTDPLPREDEVGIGDPVLSGDAGIVEGVSREPF